MKLSIIYLAVSLVTVLCTKYDGYKVYKIYPIGTEALGLLNLPISKDLDFLTEVNVAGRPISILVNPQSQNILDEYLQSKKITFSIEVKDVGQTLSQDKNLRGRQRKPVRDGEVAFDRYLTYDEINSYLARLAQDYPEIVTVESIGQTYEGRETNAIKISTGTGEPKPTIFINAGIHAREWIAPALALYIINQLVENPDNQNLIDDVNWTILPTINPDGYVYSWQEEERFWRKTRTPGQEYDGVDENRNFDYYWEFDDYECGETYPGTEAFSTIEAQNVRDAVLSDANIKLYIDLHSCGQYILYPWGYTTDLPDNWEELDALGQQVNDAIKAVNGTEYEIGSTTHVLYFAPGTTIDWALGAVNIPLAHTVELPCGGTWYFDLPPERILGVVIETFEGVKVYHDYVVQNYA